MMKDVFGILLYVYFRNMKAFMIDVLYTNTSKCRLWKQQCKKYKKIVIITVPSQKFVYFRLDCIVCLI